MLSFIRLGEPAPELVDPRPIDQVISSSDVVVFTSRGCPFCSDALNSLNTAEIPHVVVEADSAQRQELAARTGSTSVPSAWVKGTFIGGANDGPEPWMGVNPMLREGKIQSMLRD